MARILRNETLQGRLALEQDPARCKRGDRKVQEARPREEWLTLPVTPLVDEATWERAQVQLDRNKRNATRNAKREYLLARARLLPVRSALDRPLQDAPRDRAYYRCPTTEGEPWRHRLHGPFRHRAERLESGVLGAVKAFLLDPEHRAAGIAAERERVRAERRAPDRRPRQLSTAISPTSTTPLGALLDEALTAGFPADIVDRRKRDLLGRARTPAAGARTGARATGADRVPDIERRNCCPGAHRRAAPSREATPAELRRLLDLLRIEVHVIDRDTGAPDWRRRGTRWVG